MDRFLIRCAPGDPRLAWENDALTASCDAARNRLPFVGTTPSWAAASPEPIATSIAIPSAIPIAAPTLTSIAAPMATPTLTSRSLSDSHRVESQSQSHVQPRPRSIPRSPSQSGEAQASVSRRPHITRDNRVRVFSDGACVRNGRRDAIGGVGVFFGDGDLRNLSRGYGPRDACGDIEMVGECRIPPPGAVTNQTMELLAAIHALARCRASVTPGGMNPAVTLYTDSIYVIKCATSWYRHWERNGWKTSDGKGQVQNQALVKALARLVASCQARLEHVRSHRPAPSDAEDRDAYATWYGNMRADGLATDAVRTLSSSRSFAGDSGMPGDRGRRAHRES